MSSAFEVEDSLALSPLGFDREVQAREVGRDCHLASARDLDEGGSFLSELRQGKGRVGTRGCSEVGGSVDPRVRTV